MKRSRKERGDAAEEAAARFLVANQWAVWARNYRFADGEVDIVAERGDVVAFVEVKSRSTDYALPRESVDDRKRRKIARAAVSFISVHEIRGKDFRFDIIEVFLTPEGEPYRVVHLENAFELPRGFFI